MVNMWFKAPPGLVGEVQIAGENFELDQFGQLYVPSEFAGALINVGFNPISNAIVEVQHGDGVNPVDLPLSALGGTVHWVGGNGTLRLPFVDGGPLSVRVIALGGDCFLTPAGDVSLLCGFKNNVSSPFIPHWGHLDLVVVGGRWSGPTLFTD